MVVKSTLVLNRLNKMVCLLFCSNIYFTIALKLMWETNIFILVLD